MSVPLKVPAGGLFVSVRADEVRPGDRLVGGARVVVVIGQPLAGRVVLVTNGPTLHLVGSDRLDVLKPQPSDLVDAVGVAGALMPPSAGRLSIWSRRFGRG